MTVPVRLRGCGAPVGSGIEQTALVREKNRKGAGVQPKQGDDEKAEAAKL
jgi:hypothetical protein